MVDAIIDHFNHKYESFGWKSSIINKVMKRSRKVLLLFICSVFIVVVLSGFFLSWLGTKVDCRTGDEEPFEAFSSRPFVKVSLQPYADFTQKEAKQLKNDLEKHLGGIISEVRLEFEVLPNKPLSAELKNDVGTRYRADKIINSLASDADRHHIIIALTHKDISVSYKGKSDWGVLGLSLIPKKVCVISSYRVKNQKDLWKLATHEFIHTCFEYMHCPDDNQKCIMKDAKGHVDFSNKSTLCEQCNKLLMKNF